MKSRLFMISMTFAIHVASRAPVASGVAEGEEALSEDRTANLRRAPRVLEVPQESLPKAELVCTPAVRTLLGYTRRVMHLHDGHTLAVLSYGNPGANWLFLIDSRDLTVQRYDVPNGDRGSHGAALGADGNLYFMPYETGRAYRFDVVGRKFEPLRVDLAGREYTWDATGASNGCIYFGTYPNAVFAEYNPLTGTTTRFEHAAPNTKYVTSISEDSEGKIRFCAWGPDRVWMRFDPATRTLERSDPPPSSPTTFTSPLPGPPKGDQLFGESPFVATLNTEGRRLVISYPSGRLWEVSSAGKLELLCDPKAPGEVWYLEPVPGGVVGISHYGFVFRYDFQSRRLLRKQLDNLAPGGNPLMFLEAVTPRCLLGANYSQQNLFRLDPRTNRVRSADTMVARVTGEPMCAVGLKGKAYLGVYTHSLLMEYDPSKPFRFGKNPVELAELRSRYQQTRPRDAVTDGKLVYIGSDSDYNYLGGALAVIDPASRHVDVYHHLIPDQNLPSLAFDPASKLLWGGTDRWGQMRSHPPTQDSSLVYAFDPVSLRVVEQIVVWPGSDETNVLGTSGNGVLVAASGDEIALIDTVDRTVLFKGKPPVALQRSGQSGKMRLGSDGKGYCLSGGFLYRWDFEENSLTPVATSPGCFYLTEVSPGEWMMATGASIYRARLRR